MTKFNRSLIFNFRVSIVLAFLSFFLPWFTFNAEMTGYYLGTNALAFALIPFVIVFTYLYKIPDSRWFKVLTGVCLFSILFIVVASFFTWHIPNITGELNFSTSLHAALPPFWISLILVVTAVILFLLHLSSAKREKLRNN